MRLLLIFAALVSASLAADLFRARPELHTKWQSFKSQHGKKYKDEAEEAVRRELWERNYEAVDKHNKEAAQGKHTYVLKQNLYSDWTAQELESLKGRKNQAVGAPRSDVPVISSTTNRQNLPQSVDHRSDVCMPPIKSQGSCGCCWAFAATTPLEFAACRKAGNTAPVILSEQQLVDCDTNNGGCNGGLERDAWKYLLNAPGQALNASYPYVSGRTKTANPSCQYKASMSAATVATAGGKLTMDGALEKLATQGPIAAGILVTDNFYSFGAGIFSVADCSGTPDHSVVLVGYGVQGDIPYWILRNSWDTTWGDKGYMLVKRGVNMCGIESDLSAPTF